MGSIASVFNFLDECDKEMKDKEWGLMTEDKIKKRKSSKNGHVKWLNKKFKNTMFLTIK